MKKNLTKEIEELARGNRIEFDPTETKFTSLRAIISGVRKNNPTEERMYALFWSEGKKKIIVERTQ